MFPKDPEFFARRVTKSTCRIHRNRRCRGMRLSPRDGRRSMKWFKRNLIFAPRPNVDWMVTHAMTPFADSLADRCRVYFAGRDRMNRSQIGYFEIDMDDPKTVLRMSERPVITLGPLGSFDDSGCSNPWVVEYDGRKYLYYTGWSLGVTVPFRNHIGLAISEDGGETYQKVSRVPILDRNEVDPYMVHGACVLREDSTWKMWYCSCTKWEMEGTRPKHFYHIKYATSCNGIGWKRNGTICIDYRDPDEHAIARPCVIREHGIYKMWYSHRGKSYRIGYAESKDGVDWERRDKEAGIDVSESGWDSEMICYPHVFQHKGREYMLYNGNGYGKTGIGLAVLTDD